MPEAARASARHQREAYQQYRFSRLDEAQHTVGRLLQPHDIRLSSGQSQRLSASMLHCRTSDLSSSVLNYGAAIEFDSTVIEDSFILLLPLRNSARLRDGAQHTVLSPAKGACFSPSMAVHARVDADFEHRVIKISRRALERQYALHMEEPLRGRLKFDLEINLQSASGAHLSAIVDLIYGSWGPKKIQLAPAASMHSLHSMLIHALIYCQANSHRSRLLRPSGLASRSFVDRVAQYIAAHPLESLTIDRLAELGSVSQRALFLGFKKYRNTTPMAFVRSVRLARVREDLLAGEGAEHGIRHVAERWGFMHHSHFSAAYRAAYGELPSVTSRGGSPERAVR